MQEKKGGFVTVGRRGDKRERELTRTSRSMISSFGTLKIKEGTEMKGVS